MLNGMPMTNRFGQLRREMEQLVDQLTPGFFPALPGVRTEGYPAVNLWDEGTALCVEAELPGVRKDDLEIYAVGDELTIKGSRPRTEGENVTYHRQERGAGEFSRVVTLPVEIDAEKIEAVLADGVLTLRLPKAESAKPRQISVRTV